MVGSVSEWLRKTILPPLGGIVSEINSCFDTDLYVESLTDRREYVGTVPYTEAQTEHLLGRIGAERNPLAAFKTLRDSPAKQEIGSFVVRGRLDTTGDELTFEHDTFSDYQLHIILYELDGEEDSTALFAHYEFSWLTNPVKHYRGVGQSDARGVKALRYLLNEKSIPYTVDDDPTT